MGSCSKWTKFPHQTDKITLTQLYWIMSVPQHEIDIKKFDYEQNCKEGAIL